MTPRQNEILKWLLFASVSIVSIGFFPIVFFIELKADYLLLFNIAERFFPEIVIEIGVDQHAPFTDPKACCQFKKQLIIIIIVNLYWGCQHHRKSGLQKGPLKVTTNQYNYVKM